MRPGITSGDASYVGGQRPEGVVEEGRVDSRVSPPKFDYGGHRFADLREQYNMMQSGFYPDVPLQGQPPVMWCAKHALLRGGSFVAAHQRWLAGACLDYWAGGLAVSPALQRWLGQQLAEEAMAAKERRKAREDRALGAQVKK